MHELFTPFEEELDKTPAEVPLFPLTRSVLLPGEPMPLHIFEDRYRTMTKSALNGEKLIAMAHVKSGPGALGQDESNIYRVGGLGRIVMDEVLTDGRYNLILLGLKRVKFGNVVQEKPYKTVKIEVLRDRYSQTSAGVIDDIIDEVEVLTDQLYKIKKVELPDHVSDTFFDMIFSSNLPLGTLCDVVGSVLCSSSLEKQMMLEELDVIKRSETLRFALSYEIRSRAASSGRARLH